MRGGWREDDRADVLPGADRARLEVPQLDAARRHRAGAAAPAFLPRGRGGSAARRAARGAAGRTRALGRPRVHLVGHPLRIGGEIGRRGVVDGHLRIRVEIAQVQHRLRLGGDRVQLLQDVGGPLPVARELLAADAAPLRVVVDGERLLRGGLRLRQRGGGAEREGHRHREHGDGAACERESCGSVCHRHVPGVTQVAARRAGAGHSTKGTPDPRGRCPNAVARFPV